MKRKKLVLTVCLLLAVFINGALLIRERHRKALQTEGSAIEGLLVTYFDENKNYSSYIYDPMRTDTSDAHPYIGEEDLEKLNKYFAELSCKGYVLRSGEELINFQYPMAEMLFFKDGIHMYLYVLSDGTVYQQLTESKGLQRPGIMLKYENGKDVYDLAQHISLRK